MANEKPLIHQTLHGYRDGHRLLASSRPLSKEAERTMASLSDLSGHSIKKGFEEYVTGYPLLDDGIYVVAKTWYAAEMQRPGCVWTHSILIDFSSLPAINDLKAIYALFEKPSNQKEFDCYRNDLCIPKENIRGHYEISKEEKLILSGLYEHPFSPVVIVASEAQSYNELIAGIWSQQWPKLRRSFTFCSGAITPRKLGNELFDLQVIHSSSVAELRSKYQNAFIVDPKGDRNFVDAPSNYWLDFVIDDLHFPKNTRLRKFLYEFGGEFSNGREAFSKLAQSYIALANSDEKNLNITYEAIADFFPKGSDAKTLKKALIEQEARASEWLSQNWHISSVTDFMLSSDKASSFNIRDDLLEVLIKEAWKKHPDQVAQNLKKSRKNSAVYTLAIDVLPEIVKAGDLDACHYVGEAFFKNILSKNPALLKSSISWKYESEFSDLFEELALKYVGADANQFDVVLRNALNSHANKTIKSFYKLNAQSFIEILFGGLQAGKDKDFLIECSKEFIKNDVLLAIEIIKNKRISEFDILALVYDSTSKYDLNTLGLYPEIWLPLFADKTSKTQRFLDKSASIFLIIGLMNNTKNGMRLVEETFAKVHAELVAGNLQREDLSLLQEYIGSSIFAFWLSDKAKRRDIAENLRRLILSKFLENSWDKMVLKKIVQRKEVKPYFEETLLFDKGQYKLLKSVLVTSK